MRRFGHIQLDLLNEEAERARCDYSVKFIILGGIAISQARAGRSDTSKEFQKMARTAWERGCLEGSIRPPAYLREWKEADLPSVTIRFESMVSGETP